MTDEEKTHVPRKTAIVLALALTAVLPACGDDDEPGPAQARQEQMRPTGTPATPVAPADPPAGADVVQGEGFRIAVPAGFRSGEDTGSNGEPAVWVRRRSQEPTVPAQVAVLREPNPRADVLEQSYALELTKTISPDSDFTRSQIEWPGAEQAVLMQWSEPTGTERVDTRYWQLSVQVDASLALTVVAFAPAGEFDSSGVADVLRTFRIA